MNYRSLHLDQGESVILEVRKHWIVFFGEAVATILGMTLPLIIIYTIAYYSPDILNSILNIIPGNDYNFLIFFYSLWVLFLWISFFIEWTKYYLDVWYVTEKRIIDVKQKRIFSREISNLRFDKIQDITIQVHGFIPTLLNFGSVKVQTAGEDTKNFFMSNVRRPDEVRRVVFTQHNEIGDRPINTQK